MEILQLHHIKQLIPSLFNTNVPRLRLQHSAFSSTTFSASVKILATANKAEFLNCMGRFVLTRVSYPCEPSQANLSLGAPDTLPHCLSTDEQGIVSYIAGCIYFEAYIVNNFGAYAFITVSICNNSHVACVGKCNGIIIYFCCCAR